MNLLILFGTFFLFLYLGVPIVFSLALSSGTYFLLNGITLMQFVQKVVGGMDSFTILAIPFFLVAGDFMAKGGISRRMLRFANALVGWLPGGIAVTSTIASAMFGTICGSAPATSAAIGGITVPEMRQTRYKNSFIAAIVATGGLIGVVIPPSITIVSFGSTANISINSLFIGAIIPGLIYTALTCAYCVWQSKRHGYGLAKRAAVTWKELGLSLVDALLPLTTPVFIMGSIMGGIATASEAAVIAVVWSAFLGMVVYRQISPRECVKILGDGVAKAGQIIGMMGASAAFSYCLTVENVPTMMVNFFVNYIDSVWIFYLITFAIVFILGCFLEVVAIIVMVTPILMPIALAMGINPLVFGMFMCLALTVAGITPPVGLCLITTCRIVGCKIEEAFPDLLYCIGIECFVTLLVVVFPQIVTWLPSLYG